MALHSLYCADVPLRNCSLTHSPESKQGIEGKIVRFRSGRVRDRIRVRDKDRLSEPDDKGVEKI